ncbi:MAG: 50S ribosomal protein L11 methyltransferase [Chloroflexi bacterium]|nr:50S ribosomal protein L11 methyltransferase [Chloroflexota bacterium]
MSAPDPRPDSLTEISVETAGIDAELVADAFRQACSQGVAIEAPSRFDRETETYVLDGDAPALVKGYVPAAEDASRIGDALRLALQAAPLDRPLVWQRPKRLRETEWRDAWKKHFGVQRIGHGIVIVPSWIEYKPREGEIVVRIDPGMAFGTGQHPTTAMCLRALEEIGPGGAAVLDLGCGSGILSIAAVFLGARHVLALDTDPQAIKVAAQNAADNGVAKAIEVRIGTIEEEGAPDETFDLALANISGLALERLAPALASVLKPGGRLIAGGFLEDRVDSLGRAFGANGLRTERVVEDGVWRTILARRDS